MSRLKDRAAIVTGAASGIGRASAELFASEGARVLAVDRPGAEMTFEHPGIVAFEQDVSADAAPDALKSPPPAPEVCRLEVRGRRSSGGPPCCVWDEKVISSPGRFIQARARQRD